MLIVREHQREGEDGTYVASDSVICKSGPVDRSKFNREGRGQLCFFISFSQKHPDTWIGIGGSHICCKIVKHQGDGGLRTLHRKYIPGRHGVPALTPLKMCNLQA